MNKNINTKQNEEMDKYIKISEVFDQVIEHYGWNESDQSDTVDIESKKRNMRNKYDFLMKKSFIVTLKILRIKVEIWF